MNLQLYLLPDIKEGMLSLPESLSHHLANVLRLQPGEAILLTDGFGIKANATIHSVSKRQVIVNVSDTIQVPVGTNRVSLAISFTKNASRMEWLLEKITELGVNNIYPIITSRSEKTFFKQERFQKIIESAMCQSMQYYLPQLHLPVSFQEFVANKPASEKYIAHCLPDERKISITPLKNRDCLICIGPEGDFTSLEIELALANGFKPITLGVTRLRTETAGMVSVVLANQF